MKTLKTATCFVFLLVALSGCGSGSIGSTMITGSVTGLNPETSVVLANNKSELITVNANGSFSFNREVNPGTAYSVTISTDPVGEKCAIINGSGRVGKYSADVSNILVSCTPNQGAVYGTVSGLKAGSTLGLLNQKINFLTGTSDPLTISANGAFVFPNVIGVGFTYDVIVSKQPTGQTCTITNGTGTIPAKGSITALVVTCQ
ncbi:hypothetical protein AAKU67_000362 [Oxalobacteraceae bacterium GrIS 2.11]